MAAGIENTWTLSPYFQFMGLHSRETFTDDSYRNFINITNLMSWTPILCRISGLAKLYHVIADLKSGDSSDEIEGRIAYSILFARCFVEISGYNELVMLADLIVTVGGQISLYQCRQIKGDCSSG